MIDVLSDVLGTLELESSVYFRAELSAPFSIFVPENANVVRFHIASEGRYVVRAPDGPPRVAEAGDLVLVPHGSSHVLSHSIDAPAEPLDEVLSASSFDGDGPLVYGGGGAQTTLVCGHIGLSRALTHPFIETLPPLLHLRRDDGPDYRWIAAMLEFAEQEAKRRETGWNGIVERLSEILFVYVLRAQMEANDAAQGALAALVDPQLSAALAAMHADPAADWTLDLLAGRAGMSRSVFARRFSAVCDMAPMKYLTHWRMNRAYSLLAHTAKPVVDVASHVGYASEASFTRTFRDHFGEPPATLRRRLREERSGP